jgi:hypothetical protein
LSGVFLESAQFVANALDFISFVASVNCSGHLVVKGGCGFVHELFPVAEYLRRGCVQDAQSFAEDDGGDGED